MISRHSVNNAVCITTLFYNNIAFLVTYNSFYHHKIQYHIVIKLFPKSFK